MRRGRAIVFGAGKMACGLLGPLLTASGYAPLFVARRPEVVQAINRRGGYTLRVAGDGVRRVAVRGCAALPLQNARRVAGAVAAADVAFTAVGIDNLPAITPALAAGLWLRSLRRGENPLNIVACENLPGAGAYLAHQVVSAAPPDDAVAVEDVAGFSAGLTRRIMTGGGLDEGELTFSVDAAADLVIDAQGLKGALPPLDGVTLTEEFPAMVMRKLFLLNCAHAIAAYLGHLEGCRWIHEAVAHPRVEPVLRGAIQESRAALTAELPHHAEGISRDSEEALARIANPALGDEIRRVARGPRRKLSARERLLGPARLAALHGLAHDHLCRAIAAALAYEDPEDPQAGELGEILRSSGLDGILTEDCGLLPHSELARAVKRCWFELAGSRPARVNGHVALAHAGRNGTRPAVGPDVGGDGPEEDGSRLAQILESVAADLSRSHDPVLVREVLDGVAEGFRRARIWSYVPILLRRKAAERLEDAHL